MQLRSGSRRLVEGFREVQHVAAGQGSEAGVQMVEAWIDEMQRADLGVPGIGDVAMALQAGADAVRSPEMIRRWR